MPTKTPKPKKTGSKKQMGGTLMMNFPIIGSSVINQAKLQSFSGKASHYNNFVKDVNNGTVKPQYMKVYNGGKTNKKTKTKK
jgi:hypothetical protein